MHASLQKSPASHKRSAQGEWNEDVSPSKLATYHPGYSPQQQWQASGTLQRQSPQQQQCSPWSGGYRYSPQASLPQQQLFHDNTNSSSSSHSSSRQLLWPPRSSGTRPAGNAPANAQQTVSSTVASGTDWATPSQVQQQQQQQQQQYYAAPLNTYQQTAPISSPAPAAAASNAQPADGLTCTMQTSGQPLFASPTYQQQQQQQCWQSRSPYYSSTPQQRLNQHEQQVRQQTQQQQLTNQSPQLQQYHWSPKRTNQQQQQQCLYAGAALSNSGLQQPAAAAAGGGSQTSEDAVQQQRGQCSGASQIPVQWQQQQQQQAHEVTPPRVYPQQQQCVQQQQQHLRPSQNVWRSPQQQQQQHTSGLQGGSAAVPPAAAAGSGAGLNFTSHMPTRSTQPTDYYCSSGSPSWTHVNSSSGSNSSVKFSSIWKQIRHSMELQQAVVDRNITLLCDRLGLDEWHIRHEVARLNNYFNLTFPLRLVCEQYGVLDFISSRTLMQLSHLPPDQITTLDTWLKDDMMAAAAGGSSSSSSDLALCDGPLTPKHARYWSSHNKDLQLFRSFPPSWAILQLILAGRLKWVPAAAAAAQPAAAAAAAGPFTAKHHGSYVWQHGPVDAWLTNNAASSSSSSADATTTAAAAAAAERNTRAEQLQRTRFPRNQAKLLLDHSALSGSSSSSANGTAAAAAMSCGYLDFSFHQDQLSHSSSCHLQRHNVLGAHDRLIRVTGLKAAASTSNSSGRDDIQRAIEAVLTYGVMLAGRRYRRIVQKDIGTDGESVWLLATESVAPEDIAAASSSSSSSGVGWPPVTPAAARQLLGGISSLPSISKQSARGALLVSNAVPVEVPACRVIYIPDVEGPTDHEGNLQHSSSSSNFMLSDGAGYISSDLSCVIPAVSSGEIITSDRGAGGPMWPVTPMQVRVFDTYHHGGVIAKGVLLPLSAAVLPPQTLVIRSSQIKTPAAQIFLDQWIKHWNATLTWAHQQHQCKQQQQQQQQQQRWGVSSSLLKAAEAAAAASSSARAPLLENLHPQDRPWFQQIWYVEEAKHLYAAAAAAASSSRCILPPPTACQQQQQRACEVPCCGSSSSSSSNVCCDGSRSNIRCCNCTAVLEVVNRAPPPGGGCDVRINKNLLLLLHHAGVPAQVFADWCDIEQHKLADIDSSWQAAHAAARAAGDKDLVNKLEALLGVQVIQQTHGSSSSSHSSTAPGIAPAGIASVSAGISNLGISIPCSGIMHFKPDLGLKMDLHDLKLRHRQKLSNMSLPVPNAADTAAAVRAGVVDGSRQQLAAAAATGGIRMLGVPDPSAVAVPPGCVAIPPDMMPHTQQAIIYRDPGIHPGDVRRVTLIPYPQQLLLLLPANFSGAIFLPAAGSSCLGASLAGGDYDGDQYLLLWDERVITHFRTLDPEPYQAAASSSGSDRWLLPPAAAAATDDDAIEHCLSDYHSFCCRMAGAIGECHTLWELYADRCGVDSRYCTDLAHCYYQALDAAKTGRAPEIPEFYRKNSILGLDIHNLPPWHSRVIKDSSSSSSSRARRQSGGFEGFGLERATSSSSKASKIIKYLWSRLQDIPEVNYLDPDLLKLDLDLVLQPINPDHDDHDDRRNTSPVAAPTAAAAAAAVVSCDVMEDLIMKWQRLVREWNSSWAQIMRKSSAGRSKAEQQSLSEEKSELALLLRARFQLELLGGVEALAAAASGAGSSSMLDRPLIEASACYQAVYRLAKAKQRELRQMTAEDRAQRNGDLGYEDMPRVLMAWRVAGQWLRMLKATKPLRQQQAQLIQGYTKLLQQQHVGGGNMMGADTSGAGMRLLLLESGSIGRLELGCVQHPYLAAVSAAEQQNSRSKLRGNRQYAGPATL